MSDSRPDPQDVLQSLARRAVAVDLPTLDLCFLAALHLRAERTSLASFPEEQLVDVFEQVARSVRTATDAATARRATHAIRRLREQRMLARVDGAGVVRAGEFALTRLATGIVSFFLEDETLTQETLVVLTRSLLDGLAAVRAAAARATTAEAWKNDVLGPLRVTIADLIAGIQRRQRGFDVRQEQLQREIAGLLQADWFGAVERCQSLLDATGGTLGDLNQVLLRDAHELQSVLQEIQEIAAPATVEEARDADDACRAIVEQVDRIAAWGSARQRAWSEYYQYVHRFLRDVVRLDPSRVITHRVRESLASKDGQRFALAVAAAPPFRLLRDVVAPPGERPPVRRRKPEAEATLDDAPAVDPQVQLESDVRAALGAGARGLAEVTSRVAGAMPAEERFVATGRIAQAIARVTRPDARADRPWVAVEDRLLIEEWGLPEPARAAGGDE
ncbi:MAG TPA: condensin subunit MukF [Polyangiaceae bacterium]|nr:condensin subunit MukF [Polyangiaceae bacterium]